MTKTQFKRKYRELVKQTADRLIEKGDSALRSGAIDPERFEDNYLLPKIVITAALKSSIYDWRPLRDEHRKMVSNLEYFI